MTRFEGLATDLTPEGHLVVDGGGHDAHGGGSGTWSTCGPLDWTGHARAAWRAGPSIIPRSCDSS